MTTPIDIRPAERNPRTISKKRLRELSENLVEFGDLGGIVINVRTGESVSGNQRCRVIDVNACEREITWRFDEPTETGTVAQGYVIYEGERLSYREVDWDQEKADRAMLVANIAAGTWDVDGLLDFDIDLLQDVGLTDIIPETELEAAATRREKMMEADDPPRVDEAFELRKKWGTEPGQLWLIPSNTTDGTHRLLCGDSTVAADVERLMNGQRAALFATDPPYLVDYDGNNHPEVDADVADYEKWDTVSDPEAFFDDFLAAATRHALEPDAAWFCWYASTRHTLVEEAWKRVGAFANQQIIWVKSNAVLGYSHYRWGHEPCLFGWARGHQPPRRSDEHLSTVWDIEFMTTKSKSLHPTSKPTEVFSIPMQQHTRRGDICYEPFSGSGSQLVAGEIEGRLVYGIERAPEYVAVILERAQRLGLEPVLEGDGEEG